MVDALDETASAADFMDPVVEDLVIVIGLAAALVGNNTTSTTIVTAGSRGNIVDPAIADRRIAAVEIDTDAHASAAGAIYLEALDVGVATFLTPHRVCAALRPEDGAVLRIRNKADAGTGGAVNAGGNSFRVSAGSYVNDIAGLGKNGSALDRAQWRTARRTCIGVLTCGRNIQIRCCACASRNTEQCCKTSKKYCRGTVGQSSKSFQGKCL